MLRLEPYYDQINQHIYSFFIKNHIINFSSIIKSLIELKNLFFC